MYSGAVTISAKGSSTAISFGLSNADGNFVHDFKNGNPQSHYIEGGVPNEAVLVEIVDSHPAHTSWLQEHNAGERQFDEYGRLEIQSSCTTPSHLPQRDIYRVTWLGKSYTYSITYVDSR